VGNNGVAQIAASVEYDPIPRPAALPDHMQALPGASLGYLSISATDGFKVQAALWQPENNQRADTTIIIGVHGNGGNLASLPLQRSLVLCRPRDTRLSASAHGSMTST